MPNYSAIVAAPDRSEADRKNDQRRNPVELFAFTGARPGMKVLDMGAGGGYSTELLARAVAPGGTVYSQTPPDLFPGAIKGYAARAQSPAMKNAVRLERPFDDPLPAGVGGLDLITFFFFYHDTVWLDVDRAQMNRRALRRAEAGRHPGRRRPFRASPATAPTSRSRCTGSRKAWCGASSRRPASSSWRRAISCAIPPIRAMCR